MRSCRRFSHFPSLRFIFHHSPIILLFALLTPLTATAPAFAGTISGKALFDGTPGENQKIDMAADPVCKSLHPSDFFAERVVVNPNRTLKNVFVYVKEGLGNQAFPTPAVPVTLDQRGCWYVPHVLGIQANQKLDRKSVV